MSVAVLANAEPATTATAPEARPSVRRDVDSLVQEHLPLVGHLVRGVVGRVPAQVNRDDLVSAGMLALVLAARSFDESRGVPFGGFAAIRIRGALTDALRSMDWAGRGVRSKARQIDAVRDDLAATLGRTPTRLEIAQAMGVAVGELDAVDADIRRASVVSIQALTPDSVEESLPSATDNPEELIIKREQIGLLHDAIAELPERLRMIVQRYFFEQRKMVEIADELGVTESRISQLRSEALVLMRAALNTTNSERREGGHGRKAVKQEAYAAAVAARSSLADRLDSTSLLGEPRQLAAVAG
jgi:RNA polymerase sigma factor for flagellar operon FliA